MNTEIYPCAKRACATLDAVRKSRIGHFQIKGVAHKEHMKAYDGETPERKVDIIYGKIEHILDTSAKVAGLTNKHYQEWGKIECLATGAKRSRWGKLIKEEKST